MDTNPIQYGVSTLGEIVAQIVHFAHDDYSGEDSVVLPKDIQWSTAYVVACFLAQHTVNGHNGVDTAWVHTSLYIDVRLSYPARVIHANKLITELGGSKYGH